MSRTHGNEKSSSQFTTSVKPLAAFLQTRDFAPLQTDLDEDVPLRPSGYTENFLEKIINQPSTKSSDTPVQAKPMNRLKTLQAQRMGIQAKLNIGEPNDKYEREADHTAVQVVQQINSSSQNQQSVQRDESMESEEKEEEELQMKPDISQIQRHESMEQESEDLQMKSLVQRKDNVGGGEASSDLESSIKGARGGGQSLDPSLQEKMGLAMGADFSGVKVHTDSQSDQLNKSIQAKAFTTGQDLFFRQGAYEPSSRGGQELIAHELTHVVQQNGNVVQRKPTTTPLARSTAKPKADIQMTMGPQQQKQQMAERVAKERMAKGGTPPSVENSSPAPAEASSAVPQGAENSSAGAAEPHAYDSESADDIIAQDRKKETQNRVGKQILDSRKGFEVRTIEGIDETKKLMNPAIEKDSSVEKVLETVNAKGGPQEEYKAIMDTFKSVKGVEKVIVAPAKEAASTTRKIADDYSNEKDVKAETAGIQRMVDLVRGSIVMASIEDLPGICEAIKAAFPTRKEDQLEGIVKLKNNFAAMEKIFNRDMNITVQLPVSKMYCEVQVHVKAFEDNKNRKKNEDKSIIKDKNDLKGWAFHGHIYYEASRIIKIEEGKPPNGVEKAKEILKHAEQEEMPGSYEKFMREVDDRVKNQNPKLEERDFVWAKTFKDFLTESQAKQSQSLLQNEVMNDGLRKNPKAPKDSE